jgi:phosphoribosylformimino-5-aminoimidazole carboxamide ribonucleotide (ProFAR) isomerase
MLKEVMQRTNKPVIASGGISSLEDLERLRELVPLGLEGAILGKSLYAGKFTLEQALKVAGE